MLILLLVAGMRDSGLQIQHYHASCDDVNVDMSLENGLQSASSNTLYSYR